MTHADSQPGPPPPAGWREVRLVATTGSTNADLVALGAAGEPAGLVLVAREQTAGRGRLGRTWTAPPGSGLTFSVLLRPGREPAQLGWVPLLAGLAVVEAVRAVTGVSATLKWPNDIVVDSAVADSAVADSAVVDSELKLGGILAERVSGAGSDGAVVVGVGLNVSLTAEQLPVPTATSLLLQGAADVDGTVLLDAVLQRLADRYGQWDSGEDLGAAYRERCSTLGRAVRAELPGGATVEGLAFDLDAAGRLLVHTSAGTVAVGAGDVVHLR